MVLGKLPVPGRPAYLDKSRARAFCACSRCGWFAHFFSRLSFLFLSPSLWETAQYRLKYCLKGPLSQKQSINQNLHKSPNPMGHLGVVSIQHPRAEVFLEVNGQGGRTLNLSQPPCVS